MRLMVIDEEIIPGGVETLRRHLLPELARLAGELTWVLPDYAIDLYKDVSSPHLSVEPLSSPRGACWLGEAAARRLLGRVPRGLVRRRLRELARRRRCEIAMTTCVFGQPMPGIDLPLASHVSDINPALSAATRANIGAWIEATPLTFTASEFTARELIAWKPHLAGRIHPVPLAPPPARLRSAGVPGTFYYPAAPNRHKLHIVLLEAARLLYRQGAQFQLILSGPGLGLLDGECRGNDVLGGMRDFLNSNPEMRRRVTILGDLPPAEVEKNYLQASCIVLPSEYEGFGLPLAEALAHGKPVICSDIPAFAEQIARYRCESCARVVRPRDAGALAAAMAAHLHTPMAQPDDLDARLALWTWSDAARRCHDLLTAAIGHG